jgi:hypothetical protein
VILGVLIGSLLTASLFRFLKKKPLKTGEGVFVVPKGVKWVSVSVKCGGGGGSGRGNSGSSTATVGITNQDTDSEMVIKLKY